MALFRCSLRMATANPPFATPKKWSNTFYLEDVTVATAAAAMVAAWSNELRGGCRSSAFAYEVYATSVDPLDDTFVTLPIPVGFQRGALSPPVGVDPMPIENCLAVPLLVGNSRPDRKYWRVPMYEDDYIGGNFNNNTLVSTVQTAFNNFISGPSNLRSSDGEPITDTGTPRVSHRRLGRQAGFNVPTPL